MWVRPIAERRSTVVWWHRFHIVVNLHNTKLWYLGGILGSIGAKAKTVGSDYSTRRMQYAACAYAAAVVYFHAGDKEYGSVAYGHALTDIYLGNTFTPLPIGTAPLAIYAKAPT